MKIKAVLILIVPFLLLSCSKDDDNTQHNYPDCLQSEVDRILDVEPQPNRASIELYTYQDQDVYVVHSNFPDDQASVYNAKCEVICSVGGFAGNENDTCEDWESAEHIETVWTDNR